MLEQVGRIIPNAELILAEGNGVEAVLTKLNVTEATFRTHALSGQFRARRLAKSWPRLTEVESDINKLVSSL